MRDIADSFLGAELGMVCLELDEELTLTCCELSTFTFVSGGS